MIPIYQALIAEEKDLPGGTTRPILATVDTGAGLEKYVVKIYDNKEQPQYAPFSNEIYGSLLASEFDIRTPEIALIRFSKDFVNTLKQDVKQRVLKNKEDLYFGNKYYEGYIQYVPPKNNRVFDTGNLETIFAFDVLVRNVDRRIGKSNLLVTKQDYLAIDHELIFSMNKPFDQYDYVDWPFIHGHRTHIFRPRLHHLGNEVKFDVIYEYVRSLDPKPLLNAAEFLHKLDLPTGNIDTINEYLRSVKKNSDKFVNLCRYLIA